jgi:hypothetical protein
LQVVVTGNYFFRGLEFLLQPVELMLSPFGGGENCAPPP